MSFLAAEPEASLGGLVAIQVVEHFPPAYLPVDEDQRRPIASTACIEVSSIHRGLVFAPPSFSEAKVRFQLRQSYL